MNKTTENPHRWSKLNIKLTVLKSLTSGTISKDEAKLILNIKDPSDYMFLTDRDEEDQYSKTKELLQRLGIIPPLIFVDSNGNICK